MAGLTQWNNVQSVFRRIAPMMVFFCLPIAHRAFAVPNRLQFPSLNSIPDTVVCCMASRIVFTVPALKLGTNPRFSAFGFAPLFNFSFYNVSTFWSLTIGVFASLTLRIKPIRAFLVPIKMLRRGRLPFVTFRALLLWYNHFRHGDYSAVSTVPGRRTLHGDFLFDIDSILEHLYDYKYENVSMRR